MSIKEKLEAVTSEASKTIPENIAKVMSKFQEELKAKGILKNIKKVGDKIQNFSLKNHKNETVELNDLLKKGKLIVTFYRGNW